MENDSQDGLNFIVHHFSGDGDEAQSQSKLLDEGRYLLDNVLDTACWRNVSEKFDASVFRTLRPFL